MNNIHLELAQLKYLVDYLQYLTWINDLPAESQLPLLALCQLHEGGDGELAGPAVAVRTLEQYGVQDTLEENAEALLLGGVTARGV